MSRDMPPRPSADFRQRLVAALEAGVRLSEAATRFPVSERTIYRWLRPQRCGESLAARPRSEHPPNLAFVDEISTQHSLTPLRARAPHGQRRRPRATRTRLPDTPSRLRIMDVYPAERRHFRTREPGNVSHSRGCAKERKKSQMQSASRGQRRFTPNAAAGH